MEGNVGNMGGMEEARARLTLERINQGINPAVAAINKSIVPALVTSGLPFGESQGATDYSVFDYENQTRSY